MRLFGENDLMISSDPNLSTKDAMILGTAGLTAGLAVSEMEKKM